MTTFRATQRNPPAERPAVIESAGGQRDALTQVWHRVSSAMIAVRTSPWASSMSGTVWVNTYNLFGPAAPICGFKMSGVGRELGSASLDPFTQSKSVCIETSVD